MRTKHLLLFFAVLVTGGFTAMETANTDFDQNTTATNAAKKSGKTRSAKAAKGIEFNPTELQSVRSQLKSAVENSADGELQWQFMGPINVGGRTRAILIDQKNANVMYAGGVAGGIYKSETNGQYWEPVKTDYNASVLSVTSIVQDADDRIYYTTGDAFTDFNISKQTKSAFAGGGVFYLDPEGTEFVQLTDTDPIKNPDFFGITSIAVDPTNVNNIYLTTWKGVYFSTDRGESWNPVAGLPTGYASDVKVNDDGKVVVAVNKQVYVKLGDGFTLTSGTADGMIDTGGVRFKFAFAPTEANYLYALGADEEGELVGVYRSTTAGEPGKWDAIALKSEGFPLFHRTHTVRGEVVQLREGIQSMAIAVDDNDKDYVLVGGMNLWAGYKVDGIEPFQWLEKTYNSTLKYHPLYITANIHEVIADPRSNDYFVVSDGGVFRYSDESGTVRMNSYYRTGQFYDVSFGPNGQLLAGSEDNGAFYIDMNGPGGHRMFGSEFIRQDDFNTGTTHAFSSLISQINSDVMFYGHSDTRIRRTFSGGVDFILPWDKSAKIVNTGGLDTRNVQMAVWESPDYPYGTDQYTYRTFKDLYKNDIDTIKSLNIAGAPIIKKIDQFYEEDAFVPFEDPYKFIMAMGIRGRVWLSHKAAGPRLIEGYDWFDVFSIYNIYSKSDLLIPVSEDSITAHVNDITFSEEGHHLYLSTKFENDTVSKYEIFRLDSMHTVMNNKKYSWGLATQPMVPDTIPNDLVLDRTQKLGHIKEGEVTSVTIDPNHKEVLVVTVAGYDDSDKVYLCDRANTTYSSTFEVNFRSIQGNLPRVPVFDGVIDVTKDRKLILGTEIGVWSTEDYTADPVVWVHDSKPIDENQTGVGTLPVTAIKQQTKSYEDFPNVTNYGVIYMSTFGGGLYVDSTSYVPRVKEEGTPGTAINSSSMDVNIYPNPVVNNLNVSFNLAEEGDVVIHVYSGTGQIMMTENIGTFVEGAHQHKITTEDLSDGIYFVQVKVGNSQKVVKFVKK